MGEKPAGLDSGEAQRVYHDIEGEGFSYAAKGYEAFRLDVASMQIDVVRDIFARRRSTTSCARRSPRRPCPGTASCARSTGSNVQLEEDEYILRGYSTSSLPSTPAGRLATIQDMMRAGCSTRRPGASCSTSPTWPRSSRCSARPRTGSCPASTRSSTTAR
jgi:hypothetical protein